MPFEDVTHNRLLLQGLGSIAHVHKYWPKSSLEEKKKNRYESEIPLRLDDLVILFSLSELGEMCVDLAAQVSAVLKAEY